MSPLLRPVLTICVVLGVAALVALGMWQLHRLSWKEALIDEVESRRAMAPVSVSEVMALPSSERRYRPVVTEVVAGGDRVAHVAGTLEGQSGYYVFTGAELPSGGEVAINHGFVPFDDRRDVYDLGLPGTVTALYREAASPGGLAGSLTPAPDLEEGTFYARAPGGVIAWLLGAAPPAGEAFYLDRTDNAGAEQLPRGGTSRLTFSNRHFSYALTWFGLAAGLLGVYIVLLRQGRALR